MIPVDFAIITIREDEFEAVLERFPTEAQTGKSGRTYGICEVQTKAGKSCKVAVTRSSEQGNDAAQQVANDVISDLDPQMLLVVGIAGGVPSDDFTLGDVIISTRIHNLDVSKRYEDGSEQFDMRGGIHPRVSNITANLRVFKALTGWNDPTAIKLGRPKVDLRQFKTDEMRVKLSDEHKNSSWYKKLQKSITTQLGGTKNSTRIPSFVTGTIASSNSVVRDIDILVQWLQTARSILAVEMESAGVYQATQKILQQYPVMAIRGISDIVGFERDNQWTKYACQTAAAFTYAFVTADIIPPRETTTVTSTPLPRVPVSATEASAQPPQEESSKQADNTGSIKIFINYAEDDKGFKKQLNTHLTPLEWDGTVNLLYDEQAELGQNRDREIVSYINSAQIILLLVSPTFLATKRTYDQEIVNRIQRQESGDAVRVIPIIVRPVSPGILAKTPFSKLQGLPRNGKPIDSWRNADEIWAAIAEEIRRLCENLRKKG